MSQKYKATGFTRFIIFMIFFAPLAYLGASYYNGEDGIANIKEFLGLDKKNEKAIIIPPTMSKDDVIEMKDQEIKLLRAQVESLNAKLENLTSSK